MNPTILVQIYDAEMYLNSSSRYNFRVQKILMDAQILNERGTSTAIFDYAKAASIDCEVVVCFSKHSDQNNSQTIRYFSDNFNLFSYKRFEELRKYAVSSSDGIYRLNSGNYEKHHIFGIPNFYHSTFQNFQPLAKRHAFVSQWLADTMRKEISSKYQEAFFTDDVEKAFGVVPHIVDLPAQSDNVRQKIGIPKTAIVGLRYGGYREFDIPWVKEAVIKSLTLRGDLYYIFINTEPFVSHKRVIFLPRIISKQDKVNFLASSDFFIHGRLRGESFGLSIAESLLVGTPVLAWSGGHDRNHTLVVQNEYLYKDQQDLLSKIQRLVLLNDMPVLTKRDNDFSPSKVYQVFKRVFLS